MWARCPSRLVLPMPTLSHAHPVHQFAGSTPCFFPTRRAPSPPADAVNNLGRCVLNTCPSATRTPSPSPPPPPINDPFSAAITLFANQAVTGTNAGASREPGEPAFMQGEGSVWYKFSSVIATLVTVRV